jgi:hypothetical protein
MKSKTSGRARGPEHSVSMSNCPQKDHLRSRRAIAARAGPILNIA